MPEDNNSSSNRPNRRTFLKGLGATTTVGLAGCSGQDGDGGDGGNGGGSGAATPNGSGNVETIEFQMLASDSSPETTQFYQDTFEKYNQQRDDVEIDFTGEFLSMDAFQNKMNTYVGAGNPPDLVYGGGNTTTFADSFVDLADAMEGNNVPESLRLNFPGVGAFLHPVALEPNGRWYRQDVFEEAGISEPPKTWSEHRDAMQTLDEHLPDDQYPSFYLASEVVGAMHHQHHAYEVMNDVNYIERTGENLDDVRVSLGDEKEGAIRYLEFQTEMYQNYSPETTSYGWNEFIQLYTNGVVQQSIYPGRLMNNVVQNAPDLEDVTKPAPIERPDHLSEDEYKAHVSINGFAVPKNAENRDVALDFINNYFFDSDAYTNFLLAVPPHTVPVDPEQLESDAFQNNEVWANHQDYIDFIQEWLPHMYPKVMGRTDPPSPYWNEICYASGIVPTMQQEVMLGRKDAAQAVDDAIPKLESTTQEVVSRYTSG